jgi:hypothetical protein
MYIDLDAVEINNLEIIIERTTPKQGKYIVALQFDSKQQATKWMEDASKIKNNKPNRLRMTKEN